jgi:hypothetical protein
VTIESVSHPEPLSNWTGADDAQPFYLELFGETSPIIDTAYAEVIPAGTSDADAQRTSAAPLYEYWWTIGHPGHPHHRGGLLDKVLGPKALWDRLEDPAARIYLYFPLGGGWRVKELAATVKYMSPVAHEQSFLEKAAQDWQALAPFVDGASKLAGAAGAAGVLAGGVADRSAKVLDGLAQIKLGSVPQIKGFEWSASKVTFGNKEHGGVMQGVVWTLPKSMFAELGGRLTGSLAVSFIPDHHQSGKGVATNVSRPEEQALLAHGVVYGPDDAEHWAPSKRGFIRLAVAPRLPR